MTPEYFEAFMQKKDKIQATGVDFMNCAELHLNNNNIWNYEGENMYVYRQGYVSPIWSRELTFKLMKQADEEGWDVAVHDCSNRTKFARGLNLKGKEGGWFGASSYGSEFSRPPFAAFLPILQDENFQFLEEEELPEGYRPGRCCFSKANKKALDSYFPIRASSAYFFIQLFSEQKGILYIAFHLLLIDQIGKIGTNRAADEDILAIIHR